RFLSNQVERQQSRWVLFGIVAGLSWILAIVFYVTYFNPELLHGALNKTIGNALLYAGFLMVPLSIGVAILRARLWQLDLLITRAGLRRADRLRRRAVCAGGGLSEHAVPDQWQPARLAARYRPGGSAVPAAAGTAPARRTRAWASAWRARSRPT